jgi:GNAT superfamily N-acetyltransferase
MPQPEPVLEGPEQAGSGHIAALNQLFSEAFTDRYQRDGLAGVRVPPLNPVVWRYALELAGEGAMIWRDAAGSIAAFNMAHHSGVEGWMGPLAVRRGLQERGAGGEIVRAGIRWLKRQGVRVIGLETMPRTVENIGFYSRLGFLPGYLTVSLTRSAAHSRVAGASRLGAHPAKRDSQIESCRILTHQCADGVDFTREILRTAELALGDTTLLERRGRLAGFAVWHAVPLAAGRHAEDLRVLKLVAVDTAALESLLDALGSEAAERRLERVTVRAQGAFHQAYAAMVDRDFRVQWTDLRMTLRGYPEPPANGEAVVFSNWEI